jgi:hypothetical protein
MEGCDALVVVGSSMPYVEFLPSPAQAPCVQTDDRAERIGPGYPPAKRSVVRRWRAGGGAADAPAVLV